MEASPDQLRLIGVESCVFAAPTPPGVPPVLPELLYTVPGTLAQSSCLMEPPRPSEGDHGACSTPHWIQDSPDCFGQLVSDFESLRKHEQQLLERREILFRSEVLFLKKRERWMSKMQSVVAGCKCDPHPVSPVSPVSPLEVPSVGKLQFRGRDRRKESKESMVVERFGFDTPPTFDSESHCCDSCKSRQVRMETRHEVPQTSRSVAFDSSGVSHQETRRPSISSSSTHHSNRQRVFSPLPVGTIKAKKNLVMSPQVMSPSTMVSFGRTQSTASVRKAKILRSRRSRTRNLIIGGNTSHSTFREQIWLLLEDPHLNRFALYVHSVYSVITVLSVFSTIIQSIEELNADIRKALTIVEICVNAMFTLEVLIRLFCTPHCLALAKSMYFWIDVSSVIPFYIRVGAGVSPQDNAIIELISCLIPILRLLKVTRHSTGWRLLVISMQRCVAPLKVPFFFLALITVFSSAIIFWVEKHTSCKGDDCLPGDVAAFISIPDTMWFALVTISTVGYGDLSPNTWAGKMCSSLLILIGVCYLSMPLAIVGTTFTTVWEDRGVILLREMTKERFAHQNISKHDVKAVFEMADEDGSNSVSLEEFVELLELFNLGICKADICKLFRTVDIDRSGCITLDEFTMFLFPEVYANEEEDDIGIASHLSEECQQHTT